MKQLLYRFESFDIAYFLLLYPKEQQNVNCDELIYLNEPKELFFLVLQGYDG